MDHHADRPSPTACPPRPAGEAAPLAGRAGARTVPARVWRFVAGTVAGRLGRSVPAVTVAAALGGLFLLGHHTGWKAPSMAELWASSTPAEERWCDKHHVPESLCVTCHPELLGKGSFSPGQAAEQAGKEKGKDWCAAHGLPESQCPLCHPEMAQVKGTPRRPETDPARALAQTRRPPNNPGCTHHLRLIQFATADAVERAGVKLALVTERPMAESVAASGEITYDQTRVARLSSRVPGTVWRVLKKVGEPVERGEVLALVDAADVGRAKTEFLQALVQFHLRRRSVERLTPLVASGAAPERQLREAESALSEARIRFLSAQQVLVNLGLPATEVPARADDGGPLDAEQIAHKIQFLGLPDALSETLDRKTTPATLLPLKAPLGGLVTSREVVPGEVVDTTKVLLVVADVARMWLAIDVRLEDARALAVGQPVTFRPDGSAEHVEGKVTWISTAVDEKTRTVKARAELDNAAGTLRARTFGAARVVLREEPRALVVPAEALHWEGCCSVVFVQDRDRPNLFHPRKVRPGAQDGAFVEILVGVLPGETVAAAGSAVLRAELLKHKLGG